MSEPFIGEVRTFGFNYAPKDWAFCDGQLLQVMQHQPLFSLMSNRFGGDGRVKFALPDLQGRAAVGYYGATEYGLGHIGGFEKVALDNASVPDHNHVVTVANANATTTDPGNAYLAKGNKRSGKVTTAWPTYADATPDKAMSPIAVEAAGRGLAHENRQPFQVVNFCIALDGLYPSRP